VTTTEHYKWSVRTPEERVSSDTVRRKIKFVKISDDRCRAAKKGTAVKSGTNATVRSDVGLFLYPIISLENRAQIYRATPILA
jgi:hypothetical protein